jgi:hypothetical protein
VVSVLQRDHGPGSSASSNRLPDAFHPSGTSSITSCLEGTLLGLGGGF